MPTTFSFHPSPVPTVSYLEVFVPPFPWRASQDILAQLPEKQRRIVRVPIHDPACCAELKDMLSLAAQYQEAQMAQKRSRSVGEARQKELRELEELRERKKHVLMTLFTKSGEAKLPAVLAQLEAFLDDPMSGKVCLRLAFKKFGKKFFDVFFLCLCCCTL
jgi:hypothetical protein